MILHPDCYKKVQSEIDRVVGSERLPTLDDRKNLPYLESVMKEVFRQVPDVFFFFCRLQLTKGRSCLFRWNPPVPLGRFTLSSAVSTDSYPYPHQVFPTPTYKKMNIRATSYLEEALSWRTSGKRNPQLSLRLLLGSDVQQKVDVAQP